MTTGPTIRVEDLRLALTTVLDRVETQLGSTVDLAADHYLAIDPADAFERVGDDSVAMTVGQLSDDVAEVRRMVESEDDPIVWHDLAHIVGVLTRLSALDRPGGR